MRVLITTNAAMGHFLPLVPTARALTDAGHEVRVGCPSSFASTVARAGLDALACDEQPTDVPVAAVPPDADRAARLAWAVTAGWPWDARSWTADLLTRARDWNPDVVVTEPMEHAGRIAAAVLGVPVVEHGWGFTLPAGTTFAGTRSLQDLYSAAGARPSRPAMTVDLGPADLQAAGCEPADRYRYVPWSPPGQSLPPTDGRVRVLVTLGTYAQADAAQRMRVIVGAAREQGAQVMVVLGNPDRGTRADFPADVTVIDWIDLTAAVSSCDIVAHHGGAGTSWATVLAGRPALVVPQAGDQFRNADLLERAGAARTVDPAGCDAVSVHAALGELIGTPAFGERAHAVAAMNARLPDLGRLADAIAELGRGA